jgi:hypothetical protein
VRQRSGDRGDGRRKRYMKSELGPPMTLGTAAARMRLIVWCKVCQRQVEPDPVVMAAYGQIPRFEPGCDDGRFGSNLAGR